MKEETRSSIKDHLIGTAIAAGVGLVLWYGVVESRLSVLETRVESVEEDAAQFRANVNRKLDSISARLDTLILTLAGPR